VYREITKAEYECICDACGTEIIMGLPTDLVHVTVETFRSPKVFKVNHYHQGCYEKIYGKLEVI
jgi:hypothetical protein